jgi:steroid 5-alpha reductase family enzyme
MLTLLIIGTVVVIVVMALLWGLGIRQHNFSYVDLGWSANFILLAVVYGCLGDGDPIRRALFCGMYGVWALRLTLHLATRILGEPEEGRYVQLRAEWGVRGQLNLKFFGFFQFQALLNILLGLPLLLVVTNTAPSLRGLEIVGWIIWAIALLGESVADAQLKKFKQDPNNRGKVCDIGLWGWSRHPNYFFEWMIWISYAVFALASPWGWLGLGLPVLMLHFLINVTGIKATEEQALRSKGEVYRQYQREVSAFIPLPRKKVS